MKARHRAPLHRRVETWLWTGPLGHLVGGTLDVAQALIGFHANKRMRSTGKPRACDRRLTAKGD
jgi:hypothetical protein